MNLGSVLFNPAQKGTAALDADGKGVTIAPSAPPGADWLKGIPGEKQAQAMADVTTTVKLPLVSSLMPMDAVKGLAKQGKLKRGVWRMGGSHKPAKLFLYLDGIIVAEFADPAAPKDGGKNEGA